MLRRHFPAFLSRGFGVVRFVVSWCPGNTTLLLSCDELLVNRVTISSIVRKPDGLITILEATCNGT